MKFAPALFVLALAGCERAGADFANATNQPVEVEAALLPAHANGASNRFILKAGETVQSVWFVDEHRSLRFRSGGREMANFQGTKLLDLAKQCPKHCILKVTNGGVEVVKTDLFGRPKS